MINDNYDPNVNFSGMYVFVCLLKLEALLLRIVAETF